MSLFDRENGVGNYDRPHLTPLEPTDLFAEDAANALDATLHSGRVMYRAGTGLMRSDGTSWVGMPRTLWVPASMGKVGATAGFASNTDDGLVRVPASQTTSTWVIPLVGLNLGDRITAVRALGQVESAGNNVTVLLDVAKTTGAAGDFSEVAMGTQQTTGALTADTLISAAILEVTGLTEVVAQLEHFFALITVTTGVTTDVAIAGVEVDIG
jgi:hypothetical protein